MRHDRAPAVDRVMHLKSTAQQASNQPSSEGQFEVRIFVVIILHHKGMWTVICMITCQAVGATRREGETSLRLQHGYSALAPTVDPARVGNWGINSTSGRLSQPSSMITTRYPQNLRLLRWQSQDSKDARKLFKIVGHRNLRSKRAVNWAREPTSSTLFWCGDASFTDYHRPVMLCGIDLKLGSS